MKDLKSETPSEAVVNFLTYRNCEIISVCFFKLLNFELICYMTIDNEYIMIGIISWILGKKTFLPFYGNHLVNLYKQLIYNLP